MCLLERIITIILSFKRHLTNYMQILIIIIKGKNFYLIYFARVDFGLAYNKIVSIFIYFYKLLIKF